MDISKQIWWVRNRFISMCRIRLRIIGSSAIFISQDLCSPSCTSLILHLALLRARYHNRISIYMYEVWENKNNTNVKNKQQICIRLSGEYFSSHVDDEHRAGKENFCNGPKNTTAINPFTKRFLIAAAKQMKLQKYADKTLFLLASRKKETEPA